MDHGNNLNRRVLNLIDKIEDKTGLMFHEFSLELADLHVKAMDSKNKHKMLVLANKLNKILDEMQ